MSMFMPSDKKETKVLGIVGVRPAPSDGRSDASNEDDVDVSQDDSAVTSKTYDADEDKYREKPKAETFSTWWSLVILGYVLLLLLLVHVMDQRLPAPLTVKDAAVKPEAFIEERARQYLKQLTSVGPRPAGSYENEVLTVDFLKRELGAIAKRAKPFHRLTVDVQKPRGSFNLDFVDGITHHYRNIQNVIAKMESGQGGSKDALLVNCHFDSVPQSPGASDDAVSCAIMLEMLDVLMQSDRPFRHNLIFLFNGAEENLLPGSHGFITQHMWASEIRAFINLEACGAGGRELVFQSGPDNPWMIEAYGMAAPHPFASVVGQEIFQSGVIPGDTDFRIFRDYGKIPGLDIAYMKNGYVYHTKYDTEAAIPPGSIQRAGDNVLAVVKHLLNSQFLSHPEDRQGSVVFFDLLGVYMVCYPEWLGILLNVSVLAASLYTTYSKIKRAHQFGVTTQVYTQQFLYTFLTQVAGCVMSFVTVTFIAALLDAMGRSMSWYSKPYLIFFLYIAPTLFTVIAVFYFMLPRHKKVFRFPGGIWAIESLYFEVSKTVWTFFMLCLMLARFKSSFLCTFWVLFPMLGRCILERIYDKTPAQRKPKDWKWMLLHLVSLLVPLIINLYLIYTSFTMFIPIMGRSGSTMNPDLIIGYKAVSMTLGTISFLCPLVMVMNRPNNVITSLYLATLITMVLVVLTRVGFPYSAKNAPHRSLMINTAREFYDRQGHLYKEDAGYFVVNLDRNSPKVLFDHVPQMYELKELTEKTCQEDLYCGMPMYYPCASMLKINNWIPTTKPRIFQTVDLKLVTTEAVGLYKSKILFRASGPDHMGIYFSTAAGVTLTNWSFEGGKILTGPVWKDERPTYYIFYSHGLSPTSWEFWLEVKVPKTHVAGRDPLMDMAVTGHIVHGNEMKSAEFKRFLAQFPEWAYPVGWTASYKNFKF